jgi:BlaR1 peptidase M56
MNELGMRLVWSAVQVSLVMAPVTALHVMASRRSAVSGSWVAAFGLALSVALGVTALLPRLPGWGSALVPSMRVNATAGLRAPNRTVISEVAGREGSLLAPKPDRNDAGLAFSLTGFGGAWKRFERDGAAPLRRSASFLAFLGMAGVGAGLCHLLLSLWAVRLCRRRGRPVDDPMMCALLDELRIALRCPYHVELVELPDLTTAATAGWRQPVVMLPDDWRTWDDVDRRAVLAHELAHVVRGDYATGLMARLATALHFYHPLVRWLASRLQLQQELAADAAGVHFAGGRSTYLLALSRLALRQDGRFPCWPARAFLPARGALITRIDMLQNDSRSMDRPWSRSSRMAAAVGLVAFALGVATLRNPAWGEEKDKSQGALPEPAAAVAGTAAPGKTPIEWLYVPENMDGFVAFRPAAALRHFSRPDLAARMLRLLEVEIRAEVLADPRLLLAKLDRPSLRLEDVEWATVGVRFGVGRSPSKKEKLHALICSGVAVRMTAPCNWLAFLRKWGVELTEVRVGDRVYYTPAGSTGSLILNSAVYLPDNRTIVLDRPDAIEKLARRGKPVVPAYLTWPDWDRASRGILAYAISNHKGTLAKHYDLGRADDAVVLALLDGVDHWVLGVADADSITLHASAACEGRDVSRRIAKEVESLVQRELGALKRSEREGNDDATDDRTLRMTRGLLANLRVERGDRSVEVRTDGFGTLSQWAGTLEPWLVEAEAKLKKQVAKAELKSNR